jgi:hypothetical protein
MTRGAVECSPFHCTPGPLPGTPPGSAFRAPKTLEQINSELGPIIQKEETCATDPL